MTTQPENPTPVPSTTPNPEPSWSDVFAFPLACIGAIIGAAVGAMVVQLAKQSNLYAIPLVGLAAGFGATLISRKYGLPFAVIAGAVALAASLLTEWWLWPFPHDNSLTYFIQHLNQLTGFSMLCHGVGAAVAFWIGWRK